MGYGRQPPGVWNTVASGTGAVEIIGEIKSSWQCPERVWAFSQGWARILGSLKDRAPDGIPGPGIPLWFPDPLAVAQLAT
jgi:hypothetical protein